MANYKFHKDIFSMKNQCFLFVLAIFASFFTFSCQPTNGEVSQHSLPGQAASKTKSGYQIYKENCLRCHGANGSLGLNGAKPLPESNMPLEERIEHIRNGKASMPAFKTLLTKEEIEAVAVYTEKLKGGRKQETGSRKQETGSRNQEYSI